MPKRKIDIRRKGPLAKRSGAITSNDSLERADYPASGSRQFTDSIKRVTKPATTGVATHMKEQGRWRT